MRYVNFNNRNLEGFVAVALFCFLGFCHIKHPVCPPSPRSPTPPKEMEKEKCEVRFVLSIHSPEHGQTPRGPIPQGKCHVAAGDRQLSCIYSLAGTIGQDLLHSHTTPTAGKSGPAHPSWLFPAILMRGRTRSPTCQVKLVEGGASSTIQAPTYYAANGQGRSQLSRRAGPDQAHTAA